MGVAQWLLEFITLENSKFLEINFFRFINGRKTHPDLYISSSSSKYPRDETAGGNSTSCFGFGTSCLTNGLR